MKSLRTISIVLIAVASAGLLLQCGEPADLLGKVEERVGEAQTETEGIPQIKIFRNSVEIGNTVDFATLSRDSTRTFDFLSDKEYRRW